MSGQDKREKVIKGLEKITADDWMWKNADYYADICKDALALLKAQEPVEPKMMEFVDKGLTWEKYEVPTCGVCGALLGGALFCPTCGKAVKWE